MGNVEVEIYISQVISFFENNPTDLMDLIGEVHKDLFYEKIRIQCEKNYDEGIDITLTRGQIVDIVLELKFGHINAPMKVKNGLEDEVNKFFQKTKYGNIWLN
jgi:hypothetical protein